MEEEIKRAKRKALQILTRMDRSEYELKNSLQRSKFSEEAVFSAIEYVKSYGYLDDFRYACQYIRIHGVGKGKIRLKFELSNKGLEDEIIENAFLEVEEFDEREGITTLLKKKWGKEEKPEQKELNKLVSYLLRRGYQSSDIWSVLRQENLT
ncbi:MAG TPA: regulatory protein RecX [Lachnospiraceae bacterium]